MKLANPRIAYCLLAIEASMGEYIGPSVTTEKIGEQSGACSTREKYANNTRPVKAKCRGSEGISKYASDNVDND